VTSAVLLVLGMLMLGRFAFGAMPPTVEPDSIRRALLVPVGFVGGVVDAVGGGGWGPVATPSLMGPAKMEPRLAIGSVAVSEFLVALGATIGFAGHLSETGVEWGQLWAILAGAVVAAPFAAWAVKVLPVRVLGTFVGALIITLNLHTILSTVGLPSYIVATVVMACIPAGLLLVGRSVVAERHDRALTGGLVPAGSASDGASHSASDGASAVAASSDAQVRVPVAGPPAAGSPVAGPDRDQGRS
jgi:hypothetical protein